MYYHITPAENLPSISRDGLVPAIGPRSKELGERVSAVYLFPSIESMEDALANWLGDAFDEDVVLALLAVDVDERQCIHTGADYEVSLQHTVDPMYLRLLEADVDCPSSRDQDDATSEVLAQMK